MNAARRDATVGASHGDGPYAAALLRARPPRDHELLLRTCLCEPVDARQAWVAFVGYVGDAKRYFETDYGGLKGLLPFVEESLARNGIDAGRTFHTYARVAAVREELRRVIYTDVLAQLLSALERARVPNILLKAAALSATVYRQPSTRHNHAIDIWIAPDQMAAAAAVAAAARFDPLADGPGAAEHRVFRHWTGLAMALHTKPFFLPYFDLPFDAVFARTTEVVIGGVSSRVMAPEDALVHVLGHAVYSRTRSNLRWACDAFQLLRVNPALDWRAVVDRATEARLALPLLAQLRWLDDALGVGVNPQTLAELARARMDRRAAEGVYAALLHAGQSRRAVLRACFASGRTAVGFLRFSAAPSPTYLRWKYNVRRGWTIPWYYAVRLLGLGWRAIARRGTVLLADDYPLIADDETRRRAAT